MVLINININNYFYLYSEFLHLATGNLPAIFKNNPDIVNLVLHEIDDDDEMSALLFDWNMLGFNDTSVANCRNGILNQDRDAIIANLVAHGAINYRNKNILFTFQDDSAIGTWSQDVNTSLR
jgi:hypothetical protein